MKHEYYFPRLAGLLQSKIESLAYNTEITDLLRDFRDWRKVAEICEELVRQAKESAESED